MHLTRPRTFVLAALIAAAVPASASASSAKATTPSCAVQPTFNAFSAFGDNADYSLAPGGDFESASGGWTFTNAGIVSGNETVGILKGSSSLRLGLTPGAGGATAISPEFCVNDDFPSFRFVTKSNGTPHATALTVNLDYRKVTDATDRIRQESTSAVVAFSPTWVPSAITPLASLLTSGNGARGKLVRITFKITAADVKAGGLSIDNVLIDPYRRS